MKIRRTALKRLILAIGRASDDVGATHREMLSALAILYAAGERDYGDSREYATMFAKLVQARRENPDAKL